MTSARRWFVFPLLLVLVGTAAGCAHTMDSVAKSSMATPDVRCPAPEDGEYQLWKVRSPGNLHQLMKWKLAKGRPVGFEMTDGQLAAIADDQRYPLEPGEYVWYRAVPRGEHAERVALVIALTPLMLAGMGGVAP